MCGGECGVVGWGTGIGDERWVRHVSSREVGQDFGRVLGVGLLMEVVLKTILVFIQYIFISRPWRGCAQSADNPVNRPVWQ